MGLSPSALGGDAAAPPAGALVTATTPRRVIYFRGHRDQRSANALVCQLAKGYETASALLHGESATRTLLNLYNLHAVRGVLRDDALVFRTSMTGPHHYFGYIDPKKAHTIESDGSGLLVYREVPAARRAVGTGAPTLRQIPPDASVLRVDSSDYDWVPGAAVDAATRASFSIREQELAQHLVDTSAGSAAQADSLFDSPGILALASPELRFPLLADPHLMDLSRFRAQIVANDAPFAFDQALVARHKHAQHRLRVVTYNYGDAYVDEYLNPGSGIFIERHEFIQAITPLTRECGGFVMLGREVEVGEGGTRKALELVACPVPFGYTLLVDVGAIHGDSTLTGLYMMAMTGNHHAMRTADTVFLKHRDSRANVRVSTAPALPAVTGLGADRFMISCDERPLVALREANSALTARITDALNPVAALWWKPVVTTPGGGVLGWHKTLSQFPQAHS